ncbi:MULTISPECIES: OmpW/AlkL family protein [Komagataeibacter]|uniref:OmpW family protein n=2 Tax=Komagataeibacter TaxID=1434011 RepID=A0A318QXQ9_9PROT|nr:MULTISPECIES: OmpW family outer membrane protein [Komagataeibacter]GBR28868.1 outer membrane protein OmpW [Komagataeibacter oboediens DSM 11826]MBL7234285.1 OmpW family protein [Komagataeibacter oboediens]MBT0674398.1 OmpW family protein [Komagataeibacter oboediens]MBT0678049.1 OmpW family protein [Komagataeibacter oboediens]MBV0887805.1 outer membrane beta-barrel protein [Komagataeibacter oboediens]
MKNIRKLAMSAALGATALAPVAVHAQTTAPSTYVNAPLAQPVAVAQPRNGHCGIFQTCATTKIGLGKGDFMIRLSAVGVLPEDRDSKVWASVNGSPYGVVSGTRIKTTNQVMPELTFEYFVTDNISLDLIATSTRHEVAAEGANVGGKLDVGSAWVLPPTVTVAWHFRPHKRLNPYVGVGGTFMWFHNMNAAGNALGTTKLNSGFTGGPSINAGVDYQLVGNWFFNFDVKQMFVRMHAWAENGNESVKVMAHDSLDPTVVSAGIAYRF